MHAIDFAATMSAAITRKQITLSELRDRLAARGHSISLTALSYWRSGRRLPERQASLDAIPELESLLDLTPGSLAMFVTGPSAQRVGQLERFDGLLDYPITDPVSTSGFRGERAVSRVSSQVMVHVGAEREILSTRMRRLVVANCDDVDGFTVFIGTDGTDVGDLEFRAIAGCRIDESRTLAGNVRSVKLMFPRPLMSGESALTEVEVRKAEGAGPELDQAYELAAEERLEEALMWVIFDPAQVPQRCWAFFSEGGVSHEWPIDLGGTFTAHYRQRDFGPGSLGIRWEW